MKKIIQTFTLVIIAITVSLAQGFKVKATGEKTFSFEDKKGENQVSFFSTTPLEDVTGISNAVTGKVTVKVDDIKTLKGSISVPVASLKTGIDLRDEHMKSRNWMDAENYPDITFVIKKVSDVKIETDNRLQANVTGDFTTHGVTKEIVVPVTMTYLDESEQTKQRAPGDLLGVQTTFNITLSEYDVENMVIGQKMAEDVKITVNIVGSSSM